MNDGEKILPRSLLITAVVAGIILGQHVVISDRVEDENSLQTTTEQLLQELKQERSLMSDLSVEAELEKKEKKNAQKRLSVIMSSRLRDLSDHNRSMEVGEQFSEIYDNEWSDAYDVFKKDFEENEPKIIAFLSSILKQCVKVSQDKARKQMERLQKDVTNLKALITKKRTKLPNDLTQRIKEKRKYSAADESPGYANILPQLKKFLPSNVRDKTGFF
ncbi:uncharacterized protein LOC123563274 [Mercenaria mercenaria]|uniref:uncharacterized protein LOC123563274 n=1 Tax=Mercenaria mercenaria TaxID=6596 RepID=UPI00234F2DB7|nr:uncharacterized protein LOC123563274 [Mercenaria mercenaria]